VPRAVLPAPKFLLVNNLHSERGVSLLVFGILDHTKLATAQDAVFVNIKIIERLLCKVLLLDLGGERERNSRL